jgi:hypothetical protein
MNPLLSPMDQVNLIGKLADLKDRNYENTLALTVLIELLIEKKLFSRQEFAQKSEELDRLTLPSAHPISLDDRDTYL